MRSFFQRCGRGRVDVVVGSISVARRCHTNNNNNNNSNNNNSNGGKGIDKSDWLASDEAHPSYFFFGDDANDESSGVTNKNLATASPLVDNYEFQVKDLHPQSQPRSTGGGTAPRSRWDFDDDDENPLAEEQFPLTSTKVEIKELLDDNFVYIPEIRPLHGHEAEPAEEAYVPGQPLIPPGMTRYRVDVQFQGADFLGWFRSTAKYHVKERKTPDGRIERVAVEVKTPSSGGDPMKVGEGMQSRHFAKTVLEEALAVAVDTSCPINVVASVIPEAGVSVRRLPCHVDLPSEIEMPPRTILKRATMWLQQLQQPLAILCCHPCRNPHFHARHSGVRRVYCYRIINRIAPPLFDAGFQWHVDRHLDVERMQRFAKEMQGTRDYGYFADPKMANALRRAAASVPGRVTHSYSAEHEALTAHGLGAHERLLAPKVVPSKGLTQLERAKALPTFNQYGQTVKTYQAKPREFAKPRTNLPTVRTVDKIDVIRQEDEVILWFVGQSFLRHQIRNMVSVLKAAGHGLWDERELRHAFQAGFEPSRKRFERERLPAAPVYGLTLWDVEYAQEHREDYVPYVDAGVLEDEDEEGER